MAGDLQWSPTRIQPRTVPVLILHKLTVETVYSLHDYVMIYIASLAHTLSMFAYVCALYASQC
jgi:hypothetical protein